MGPGTGAPKAGTGGKVEPGGDRGMRVMGDGIDARDIGDWGGTWMRRTTLVPWEGLEEHRRPGSGVDAEEAR